MQIHLVVSVCVLCTTVLPITIGKGQSTVPSYYEKWINVGERFSPQYREDLRQLSGLLYQERDLLRDGLWSVPQDLTDDSSRVPPEVLAMFVAQYESILGGPVTTEVYDATATSERTTSEIPTTTAVTKASRATRATQMPTTTDARTTERATTTVHTTTAKPTPPPPPTLTPACANATRDLRAGLASRQPWAFQMLDATGKPESALMRGNVMWLGSYSECVAVRAYTDVTRPFQGKHCSVTLGNMTSHKGVLTPTGITIGICFPDVCTTLDTYILTYEVLHSTKVKLPLDIGPIFSNCHSSEKPSLTLAAIGTIVLLGLIGAVLAFAAVYDLVVIQQILYRKPVVEEVDSPGNINEGADGQYHALEEKSDRTKAAVAGHLGFLAMLMVNLSPYTNARKLLSTQRSASSLDAIHGLRFFSMTWVLLGHTYFFLFVDGVVSNSLDVFDIFKSFAFQAISNAFVSVDSFFLLSGTLVSYLLLKELNQREGPRKVNWALFYFHRFWRLTPPYMLVLGAHTALYQYTGKGPFWPSSGGIEPTCSKDWWTNLLYLNTVLDNRLTCMGWTWYLANDMIFYIFSPIFVIALYKNKYVGVSLCGVGVLTAILTNSITNAVHNCGPNNIYGPIAGVSCGQMDSDLYYKPQYRFGPYLIGLLLGYILHRAGRNLHLKWYINATGWVVAAGGGMWVVYGLAGIPHGHLFTKAGNAAYQGLHRNVWAASMGWVVFACSTGNGGPVNALLSWSPFMVLGRLTYMGYLIHPVILSWYFQNLPDTVIFTQFTTVWLYFGFLCVTYALAFAFSLAFESPMMGLEKVIFRKETR